MHRAETLTILHLNTESGFRGGEIQTLALAAHLRDWGHRSVILAPEASELLRRCREAGLPAVPWNPRGEWDLPAALGLRRLLREEAPNILHAHTAHALTMALLAGGRGPLPRVVGSRRVSFGLRSALSRAKYRRADAVVAVCGSVAEGLLTGGIPPSRVHVIHSGIDLDRFRDPPSRAAARSALGLSGEGVCIGVVGALAPHKGHRIFLEALGMLAGEFPNLEALLVGEGEERGFLERRVRAEGLPVRFAGFLGETAVVYPALDLLVLPSLSGEGSPAVIKEAAAAGVPVAATDVGGSAEILRPDREALLVPPGDPAALAGAARRILLEESLARSLVEAARRRVAAFSTESTARRTLDLYRMLLAE